LGSLLDDIAKNPAYDAQFALVTMGGKRNLNLNGGEFSVADDAYNDAGKGIGAERGPAGNGVGNDRLILSVLL